MRNPLIICSVVLLSACAVGPDYVKPPRLQGEQHALTLQPSVTSAEQLPDNWWRLYADPQLDALIGKALTANTDLRVAVANLERVQAVLRETGNARFPATSLSAGSTWGDSTLANGSGTALNEQQLTRYGGLTLSWELDLVGRVRRTIEAAEGDWQAEIAARDAVRTTVVAETVRQYTLACTLAQSVAENRESQHIASEYLRLTQAMLNAGGASQYDVERATVTLANTQAQLPLLEARRKNALVSLAVVTGATPSAIPPAADSCQHRPVLSQAIPVGDGVALLQRRPDVREAERRLAANTARVGVATADLYPRITLGGSLNYLRNRDRGTDDVWSFGVGPLLSWNMPNNGAARARLAQSEANSKASLAHFDGTVLNALKETEQAISNLRGQSQRHSALSQAQVSAQQAWRLADERYRNGSISALEMLDSSRERITARSALAESDVDLVGAQVDLFKSLGGGWQSMP